MSKVEISPEQAEQIRGVMQHVRHAEDTLREARALRQEVLRELHAAGMKVGELASFSGVCPQRVSKILDGNAAPRRKRRVVGLDGNFPAEWATRPESSSTPVRTSSRPPAGS